MISDLNIKKIYKFELNFFSNNRKHYLFSTIFEVGLRQSYHQHFSDKTKFSSTNDSTLLQIGLQQPNYRHSNSLFQNLPQDIIRHHLLVRQSRYPSASEMKMVVMKCVFCLQCFPQCHAMTEQSSPDYSTPHALGTYLQADLNRSHSNRKNITNCISSP